MIELDKKVFGSVVLREIIGAVPPAFPDTRDHLENELAALVFQLKTAPRPALEGFLKQQRASDSRVNSRPGAMALAQNKIQLYNEYSKKYTQAILKKLES